MFSCKENNNHVIPKRCKILLNFTICMLIYIYRKFTSIYMECLSWWVTLSWSADPGTHTDTTRLTGRQRQCWSPHLPEPPSAPKGREVIEDSTPTIKALSGSREIPSIRNGRCTSHCSYSRVSLGSTHCDIEYSPKKENHMGEIIIYIK